MNFRPIMLFLIAALMLLGVSASALAAENVEAPAKADEISFDRCSMGARLQFKDGKDGCLQNNRYFSNLDNVKGILNSRHYRLALSLNHSQCPAVSGASDAWGNQGIMINPYLDYCNNALLKAVGSDAPQCKCQPVEDIARNMSKEDFYEFERSFASRQKTGWAIADLSNAPSVSQSPAIPATAENLDLRKDTLAKADEDRRQKDALAKAEEDRRQKDALAKANEDRRQKDALAKAGEDRRQKEALAKAEAERQKQEALAKAGDERNQQVALAQAENLRLTAELSKLREQLSNQGGVNPVANIRKALIIGNDSYRSVPPLVNARADARLISENLSMFGYAVTLKMDLTEKQMKEALRVFKGQVNPGDEVAIFYAGHGVQLGSANYLLPVDVGGDNEEQVRDEAIPLQRILDDMTDKKAKFTLAMIDACRDNPFKSSGRSVGGTRGLAVTSAATGQMVIFSAGTGQQALDKLGPADKIKNGVFTRVFVEQMKVAGAPITNVMRNVRNEVARLAKTIGHDQVPAIYDQVLGDFYFSN